MDALGEWKASAGGDPFLYGTPVCDPTFDPSSRAAQQFLYDACTWARGNATKLSMREQNQYYQSGLCFMEYFAQQARTATGAFPAPPEMFNAVVARTLSAYGYFSSYVGLSDGWPASCGVGTPCRVTFLAVCRTTSTSTSCRRRWIPSRCTSVQHCFFMYRFSYLRVRRR